MTTILDPLGTPAPVYNRSGTVIVTLTAGSIAGGGIQGDAIGNEGTIIPSVAQTTVALVVTSHTDTWNVVTTLSASAEIGDVVEVHPLPGGVGGVQIFPPIGQSINEITNGSGETASTGTNKGVQFTAGAGVSFRKVSSTLWMTIGS